MSNTLEWRHEVRQQARVFIEEALHHGGRFETADLYEGFQTVEVDLCDETTACEHNGRHYAEFE